MNTISRTPSPELIRVLLVEDDPASNRLLQDLLDAAGTVRFLIDGAKSLEDGLDRLQHGAFDVCLLSSKLKDGDGLDLLVLAKTRSLALPVIVLDEGGRPGLDQRALALGALACLDKGGLSPKSLERAIRYGIHQQKLAKDLAQGALFDEATGLSSPSLYKDRLDRAIAFARRNGLRVAVMLIEPAIPKEREAEKATLALAKAGRKLTGALREMDTVARLGDRRLALLIEAMPGIGQAAFVARKVLKLLDNPPNLEGQPGQSAPDAAIQHPSIGVAIYPSEGVDGETLMRRAEAALRKARSLGGARCRFASERIDHEARPSVILERSLKDAIKRRELRLRFHPEMHFRRQDMSLAAEAFWRHPKEGWQPVDPALARLDDDRQLADLVDWVLTAIFERMLAWRKAGLERAKLSIALPLQKPSFLPLLTNAIEQQTIAKEGVASQLEIDLPEGLVLTAHQGSENGLKDLKATGVRLAIDGFGGGGIKLQDLPFDLLDGLKLAPHLHRFPKGDKTGETLLKAIITLGHSLNLEVTAKAAEDQRQFALLKELGCDAVQLRGLLAPMSAKAATNWLRASPNQEQQSSRDKPKAKPEVLSMAQGRRKASIKNQRQPSTARE